jgi:hypothetical protein
MATASDRKASCVESEQSAALLPQPLGVLPTRQFWQDEENQRRGCLPFLVSVVLLSILISALDPPWWAALLIFPAMLVLMKGLSERYVRETDKRHVVSRPDQVALDESSEPRRD